MTERARRHCHRSREAFVLGPSAVRWDGQALQIDVDEWSVPLPARVRGRIRLYPDALLHHQSALDARRRHRWGPIAPSARIEVAFTQPALRWSGRAYLDSNEGDEPIARACREWDWSRSELADGSTAVLYDLQDHDGSERLLALRFARDGRVEPFAAPPRQALPRTAWRLARRLRSEGPVRVGRQLEDTPFYQRAVLHSQLLGEPVQSFHETLCVPRLVSPVVQAMLPWRMPRRP